MTPSLGNYLTRSALRLGNYVIADKLLEGAVRAGCEDRVVVHGLSVTTSWSTCLPRR